MEDNCSDYKILHIFSSYGGGISTVILNLTENKKENFTYDMLAFSYREGAEFCSLVKAKGSSCYTMPRPRVDGVRSFFNYINRFFLEHHYDAVHCHIAGWMALPFYKAAKHYGVKSFFIHAHTTKYDSKIDRIFFVHLIDKLINYKIADCYFFCSACAANYIFGHKYMQKKESFFVPNGINGKLFDTAITEKKRLAYRMEFGIGKEQIVLGHVGRFSYSKNHDEIINIAVKLKERGLLYVLILVGDGERIDEIKEKAQLYGVKDNIRFVGRRNDIAELMQFFDIMILPSFYEGLANVTIECQASGTHIFVSDTITRQCDMKLGLVTFLPLNDTETWVTAIINQKIIKEDPSICVTKINEIGYNAKKIGENYCTELEKLLVINRSKALIPNKWKVVLVGSSQGKIILNNGTVILLNHKPKNIEFNSLANGFEIISKQGKIADTQESFLFCYTEINPYKENMIISTDTIVQADDVIPDYQTGYGICAVDSLSKKTIKKCFRNYLLVGRARLLGGFNHASGVRCVCGNDETNMSKRILDPSRLFKNQKSNDDIEVGDFNWFQLAKTDNGFQAQDTMDFSDVIEIPGCDFLLQQNKKKIYVGILVSGKIHLRVENLSFSKSKGRISFTEKGFFKNLIPHYPFELNILNRYQNIMEAIPNSEKEKNEYIIEDGVYNLKSPIQIPACFADGISKIYIRAKNPGKVIFDGAQIRDKIPLVLISGSNIELDGFVFQNSKSCGIQICGSHNILKHCIARANGDTGILICSLPEAKKEDWPSFNNICCCESFDNCDTAYCNADGFGAKLRIGPGNRFINCIAHHNIDDGFDLYTKTCFGETFSVELKECEAYSNGKTLNQKNIQGKHQGSGFKLGGENICVSHTVDNCIAHDNCGYGIYLNSNKGPKIYNCQSYNNGKNEKRERCIWLRIKRKIFYLLFPHFQEEGQNE